GKVWAFHADSCKPLAGFDNDFSLDQFVFSPKLQGLINVEANAVVIRNPLTGKAVRTLRGHVQNITFLGLAADGSTISTLDASGEHKVWTTAPVSPLPLRVLPNASGRSATGVVARLSPDGHHVVGVPVDEKEMENPSNRAPTEDVNRLALWDAANGRMQPLPLRPMPEGPGEDANRLTTRNDIQYSANGRFVCLTRSRRLAPTRFAPFGGSPPNAVKNDPEKVAALKKYDFSDVTVWDTATGRETAYLQLPLERIVVNQSIQLSPDGKTLVHCSSP